MSQHAPPEVDPWHFLSRVTAPTLMLNGRFDFYFPLETSQKPFFEHLGVPADQKRMVVSDLGHTVSREEVMRESFEWLDRWLDER
jgi:pimeloyl-ACP methyl ester carboxylesterase